MEKRSEFRAVWLYEKSQNLGLFGCMGKSQNLGLFGCMEKKSEFRAVWLYGKKVRI